MTDEREIELRPCPFCGNEPIMRAVRFGFENEDRHTVRCPECDFCIGWAFTEEEAAEKWNRRREEKP